MVCRRSLLWYVTIVLTMAPYFSSAKASDGSETCAESIILAAAKSNVASVYGNRPESGGDCALGVRQSLQLSGVGDVTGPLGNAIDYLQNLPPHGFVDTGLRDPNTAIPGSVIVFSGPDSESYLQTGNYGTPPGDWLGHVTIKGDDGYYYTDARTVEPAIGWENGVNVEGIRDVAGIFVPDAQLDAQYAGKCSTLTINALRLPSLMNAALAIIAPVPALAQTVCDKCQTAEKTTADFRNLDYRNTDDQRSGRRQMRAAVDQLKQFMKLPTSNANRKMLFHDLLALGREALPYDGEGQFTHTLVNAMKNDAGLQAQFDRFIQTVSKEDQEPCKTERMITAINEANCLTSAGIAGQDFVAPGPSDGGKSCISKFNYVACLKEKGH